MLNRYDLKGFREHRGLSFREVANYCDLSHTMIMDVENGTKTLNKGNHDEIVKGINLAYQAKVNGTLQAKNTKKTIEPEKESPVSEEPKLPNNSEVKEVAPKKATTRKSTKKVS